MEKRFRFILGAFFAFMSETFKYENFIFPCADIAYFLFREC